ncbi:MAG: SpoIIE family protein phosphatase, partial [Caldithrix sp.]|nr:SpoIIE family protein phosphatase [Caldithrix sp.]
SKTEALGKFVKDVFQFEDKLVDFSGPINAADQSQDVVGQILTKYDKIRYISRKAKILRNAYNTEIIGAVESFHDDTKRLAEQQLLEKRYLQLQTINAIGQQIAISNDLQALFKFIGQKLVTTFFESSQISLFMIVNNKQQLALKATAGLHNRDVKKNYPVDKVYANKKSPIYEAFFKREKQIVEQVDQTSMDHQGVLQNGKSIFAFPLKTAMEVAGVLAIENNEPLKLDESDIYMIETVSEYLGISIERISLQEKIARQNELLEKQAKDLKEALSKLDKQKKIIEKQKDILEEDLSKASEFQHSLLPDKWPVTDSLTFAARFIPSTQLGGDYYDVFRINDQLIGILVADASGHGTAAAMLSAMFKMTLEKYAYTIFDPGKVFTALNKDFTKVLQMGEFFTAFYAIYDEQSYILTYGNAAHPPPIMLNRKKHEIMQLDTEGFLLGAMDVGLSYESKQLKLEEPYRMIIFTDGVTECADLNNKLLGTDKIKRMFLDNENRSLKQNIENLTKTLNQHANSDSFEDDVTILMIDFFNGYTKKEAKVI